MNSLYANYPVREIASLLEQECPNGVDFKSLGVLEDSNALELGRGQVISAKKISEHPGDYPVYSSASKNNGIFGTYGLYMFEDARITWSVDSGGKFFYRRPHRYSVTNVSGWLKVHDESLIAPKFLFHVLTAQWERKVFDYTHKAHPSVIRNEYLIPLPPLEVQERIVEILDSFTELDAVLRRERELRDAQLNHYSEALLDFDNAGSGDYPSSEIVNMINTDHPGGVPRVTVGEHVKIENGRDWKSQPEGNVPVFGTGGPMGVFVEKEAHEGPSVLLPRKGSIGIQYVDHPFWNVDTVFSTTVDPQTINIKFFYYAMCAVDLISLSTNSTRPSLTQTVLKKVRIPLPSIAIQERIVDVLDGFTDYSVNLDREIELRQKQLEYYREQLLTFPTV